MINELIFAGLIGELPSCVKKKKKEHVKINPTRYKLILLSQQLHNKLNNYCKEGGVFVSF